MDLKETFAGLPWWVTWIAIPAIALVVFGGLLLAVLGIVAKLLFKVLIFVLLVGGLVHLVRRFTSSGPAGGR